MAPSMIFTMEITHARTEAITHASMGWSMKERANMAVLLSVVAGQGSPDHTSGITD